MSHAFKNCYFVADFVFAEIIIFIDCRIVKYFEEIINFMYFEDCNFFSFRIEDCYFCFAEIITFTI